MSRTYEFGKFAFIDTNCNNIKIMRTDTAIKDYEIPKDVLFAFIAELLREERIKKLEDMSISELLNI